jgi:Fic family protein
MGTTEALVMQGFVEDLVARSSTNIEPTLLIDILRDQEAAVKLVMDCITRNRELSISVMHELHSILTQHQPTTKAVDPLGNRVEIPLLRGAFKQFPNNPIRPDKSIHEYCPPIHVDSEIDNLLKWLKEYEHEDPLIVTAWFHHRFTQIHPYQDGNGRVARAIGTLIMRRSDLLPLVIYRDVRIEYINALEKADLDDLTSLVNLFSTLEKRAILQALSIDIDSEVKRDMTISRAVIDSFADRLQRRKLEKDEQLRNVNQLAVSLRGQTKEIINNTFHILQQTIKPVADADIFITIGGPDHNNEYWYKYEVIESGNKSGKWVNFDEDHYFIKASIRSNNIRLVFVVSFHHIGRELSGILEVTSFGWLEYFEEKNDRAAASDQYFTCSLDPFVITWNTEEAKIVPSFRQWLDAALAIAIKEWTDRV